MKYEWEDRFPRTILSRGKQYCRDARVCDLTRQEKSDSILYQAIVDGTYTYRTQVTLTNGNLKTSTCTCPYNQNDSLCKHIAATLYAIAEVEPHAFDPKSPQHSADRTAQTLEKSHKEDENPHSDAEIDLSKQLEALSPETLRKLLVDVANTDPAVRSYIIQAVEMQSLDKDDPRSYYRRFCDRSWHTHVPHQTIRSFGSLLYAVEVTTQMQEQLTSLFEQKAYAKGIELAHVVFEIGCVAQKELTNEACKRFCNDYLKMWAQLFAEPDAKQSVNDLRLDLDTMCAKYGKPYAEQLWDAVFSFPWQEPILTHLPELLNCHMTKARLMQYLQYMEKSGKTLDELITYLEGRSEPYATNKFLELCEKHDPNRAIPYVLARFEACLDPFEHIRCTRMLISLYDKVGDNEQKRDALLYLIFVCKVWDADVFDALYKCVAKDTWQDILLMILSIEYPQDLQTRCRIYKSFEMYDLLLMDVETLASSGAEGIKPKEALHYFLRYEAGLSKRFPEETYQIFRPLLLNAMDSAKTREEYQNVIKPLKRLKKYPDGKARQQFIVDHFYQTYAKRHAMKEELVKAGYQCAEE